MAVCQFFTHGKNFLINQRSFTMWKALLTILSTLSVQKFTACEAASTADFGWMDLRFFYAWKKYPYESMALQVVGILANNLIHIFCAELHS
jgi:hypothetical protein